jgi:hypothetical protein
VIDYLLLLAEQFDLLAAKIGDLQELFSRNGEATGRLESAQEAIRQGVDDIRCQIETIRASSGNNRS